MSRLQKLRTISDGALKRIDQTQRDNPSKSPPPSDPALQRAWWDGYRQCVEDAEFLLEKEGDR